MNLSEIEAKIIESINANRKIGNLPKDYEEELKQFLEQVDCINNHKAESTRYFNNKYEGQDIVIADVFSDFIAPCAVTVTGSLDEEDWLVKSQELANKEPLWDLSKFIDFAAKTNVIFKRDNSKVTTVKALRTMQTLNHMNVSKYSYGKQCPINADPVCIPWQLKNRVFKEYFYAQEAVVIAEEFVTRMFLNQDKTNQTPKQE